VGRYQRPAGPARAYSEKEYCAAKERERAGERAEKAWDRRAGLAAQRRECDRAIDAERAAHERMATTRPTTPAGAAAKRAAIVAPLNQHGLSLKVAGKIVYASMMLARNTMNSLREDGYTLEVIERFAVANVKSG
jgi:hypothetical protein